MSFYLLCILPHGYANEQIDPHINPQNFSSSIHSRPFFCRGEISSSSSSSSILSRDRFIPQKALSIKERIDILARNGYLQTSFSDLDRCTLKLVEFIEQQIPRQSRHYFVDCLEKLLKTTRFPWVEESIWVNLSKIEASHWNDAVEDYLCLMEGCQSAGNAPKYFYDHYKNPFLEDTLINTKILCDSINEKSSLYRSFIFTYMKKLLPNEQELFLNIFENLSQYLSKKHSYWDIINQLASLPSSLWKPISDQIIYLYKNHKTCSPDAIRMAITVFSHCAVEEWQALCDFSQNFNEIHQGYEENINQSLSDVDLGITLKLFSQITVEERESIFDQFMGMLSGARLIGANQSLETFIQLSPDDRMDILVSIYAVMRHFNSIYITSDQLNHLIGLLLKVPKELRWTCVEKALNVTLNLTAREKGLPKDQWLILIINMCEKEIKGIEIKKN